MDPHFLLYPFYPVTVAIDVVTVQLQLVFAIWFFARYGRAL